MTRQGRRPRAWRLSCRRPRGSGQPSGSDAERVDQLALLERVKTAAAAAQARVTAAFVASQQQVARARECSVAGDFAGWRAGATRGAGHVALAVASTRDLPHTLAAPEARPTLED